MILPTPPQQVMRGANGTGMAGDQGAYHLEGITALDERGPAAAAGPATHAPAARAAPRCCAPRST